MRQVLAVLLLALLLLSGSARAQSGSAEIEAYDMSYNMMIRQSLQMPQNFDFGRLRGLYSHTSFFRSHGVSPEHDFPSFFSRLRRGDDTVLDEAKSYSRRNVALLDTNVYASSFFRRVGREDLAEYHDWMTQGLLRDMQKNGDGTTQKKAIKVLIVPHEYGVVARSGRKVVGRRVDMLPSGKFLKVLTVRGEDGSQEDLWFEMVKILPLAEDKGKSQ